MWGRFRIWFWSNYDLLLGGVIQKFRWRTSPMCILFQDSEGLSQSNWFGSVEFAKSQFIIRSTSSMDGTMMHQVNLCTSSQASHSSLGVSEMIETSFQDSGFRTVAVGPDVKYSYLIPCLFVFYSLTLRTCIEKDFFCAIEFPRNVKKRAFWFHISQVSASFNQQCCGEAISKGGGEGVFWLLNWGRYFELDLNSV